MDANGNSSSRSGTITAGGQTFTVNQAGVPPPLASGLDTSNLVWVTATDYPWQVVTDVKHDGVDAAAAGNHSVHDSISWIQTTVVGPGTIAFWWKVASDLTLDAGGNIFSSDYLEFLINGEQQNFIMGQIDWNYREFPVPPGTNTLTWQYVKDPQFNAGADIAWLDQVTWSPGQPISLATALDTCSAEWSSGGSDDTYWKGIGPWGTGPALGWSGETNITHDGKSAARSGTIYFDQETWMQAVVSGVSNVSFWWKVSSQTNNDFLEFYTNDVLAKRISGEVNWQSNSFKLSASNIVSLKWRYSMTNGIHPWQGQEAGWVDQVVLSPTNNPAPIVTLLGSNPTIVECHGTFTDPGATAQDGCSGTPLSLVTNGSVNPNITGVYPIQYVATNSSGTATTNSRTVNVVDTTPPQITLNGSNSITIECHDSFTDPGATALDVCAGSVSLTTNGSVNPNLPGVYTITYVAADSSGNSATNTRSVNVVDTTPPTIVYSFTNLTIAATTNCTALLPDFTTTNYILATDNCSSVTVTQAPPSGTALGLGANQVILTASDSSGNTASCTNAVIVIDATAPLLVCPVDLLISADPGQCSATNVSLGTPNASDECGGVSVTNDAPSIFPVGTNIVTWTATDDHGNATNCSQLVVVTDVQLPNITGPDAVSVPTDPGTNCATGVNLGTPVTSDNCGIAGVTNDAPTSFPLGTNTVTWTATDVHGNMATCMQQVVVTNAPRLPHRIISIVKSGPGSFTLSFTGAVNSPFIVQASSNLIDWFNIYTHTSGPDGTWTCTDSTASNSPARFYRSLQP